MIRDEVVWYATVVLLALLAFYILPTYERLTNQTDSMHFVLTDQTNAPSPTSLDSGASLDPNDPSHDYVRKSSLVPQTCIGCANTAGSITGSANANSTVPGDQDSAISEGTKMEPDPFLTSFAAFGH